MIASIDLRLFGVGGNLSDNSDSRIINTAETEQEENMKKLKPSAKKSSKSAKPASKGKVSGKKGRNVEEDEDDEDLDEDADDEDLDDEDLDDEDSDDEDGDDEDSDDEDSDDEDDDEDDEDSDDEDDEDSDDEDSDDEDSDDEDSDDEDDEDSDDEDSDDEDSDDEDSDSDDADEEEEAEELQPKLKKGNYTINKTEQAFEVIESAKGGYKKGDAVAIKRATQAVYNPKTCNIEVTGAKDTAKRVWVVLEAKKGLVVVPVADVLNARGKRAELQNTEAEAAPSKKSAKVEKVVKSAKEEVSSGKSSNKALAKKLTAIRDSIDELLSEL
jgi:hypothetical protein